MVFHLNELNASIFIEELICLSKRVHITDDVIGENYFILILLVIHEFLKPVSASIAANDHVGHIEKFLEQLLTLNRSIQHNQDIVNFWVLFSLFVQKSMIYHNSGFGGVSITF